MALGKMGRCESDRSGYEIIHQIMLCRYRHDDPSLLSGAAIIPRNNFLNMNIGINQSIDHSYQGHEDKRQVKQYEYIVIESVKCRNGERK